MSCLFLQTIMTRKYDTRYMRIHDYDQVVAYLASQPWTKQQRQRALRRWKEKHCEITIVFHNAEPTTATTTHAPTTHTPTTSICQLITDTFTRLTHYFTPKYTTVSTSNV